MTYLTSDNLAEAFLGARHRHVSRNKTIITQSSTTHKTNSLINRLSSEKLAAWQPMTLLTQWALDVRLVRRTFSVVLRWVSSTFRGGSLCRESRTFVLLWWCSVPSFGTNAYSVVLVIIRVDVPKHWMVGYSSLCFNKFCNISDSDLSFQLFIDVISLFSPSLS